MGPHQDDEVIVRQLEQQQDRGEGHPAVGSQHGRHTHQRVHLGCRKRDAQRLERCCCYAAKCSPHSGSCAEEGPESMHACPFECAGGWMDGWMTLMREPF